MKATPALGSFDQMCVEKSTNRFLKVASKLAMKLALPFLTIFVWFSIFIRCSSATNPFHGKRIRVIWVDKNMSFNCTTLINGIL